VFIDLIKVCALTDDSKRMKRLTKLKIKIMRIEMKDGYEITEEILQIAKGYNFYACYIDSYTQMKAAEDKNIEIMQKLRELGVEKLKQI